MAPQNYPLLRERLRKLSRASGILLMTILLIASFGCVGEQKKQAQDLVKDGSATADHLAKYYDALSQQRADHLSLTIFELQRANSTLQPDLRQAYKDQQEALAARAQMARKLKNVYDSLGKLIDYDAPGEVSGAVGDLKDAIEKASNKKLSLPGQLAGVDPKPILDKAVKAFVGWFQIRQFRKNAPKAAVILDSIYNLFDAEKEIYLQISKDYNKITFTTAKYLYEHDQLTAASFFSPYVELYGLQVYQVPTTDKDIKGYVVARLAEKLEEFDDASAKQTQGQLAALAKLRKTHEDFMLKRKPKENAETARHNIKSTDTSALAAVE